MLRYKITYSCDTSEQCNCTTEIESDTVQGIIKKIEEIEKENPVFRIQKIIDQTQ